MSRTADPHTKDALLRAAEEVFAERGLASARVEDIARLAGVSKGAFYLHFESKEAALEQLVQAFLAGCSGFFAPPSSYPDLPEDPHELLAFTAERDLQIYEFLWENRSIVRIIHSCRGEYDHLVEAFRAEVAVRTRAWVRHFQEVGLFRQDIDADLVATLMCGAHHELSEKMFTSDRRPPIAAWLEATQSTFFRGLGTPALLAVAEDRKRDRPADIQAPANARTRRRPAHVQRERS